MGIFSPFFKHLGEMDAGIVCTSGHVTIWARNIFYILSAGTKDSY